MSYIAGMTDDGFDYTAICVQAVQNSVAWAATFSLDGNYRGIRHGKVFGISGMPITDLRIAIRNDIECVWGIHPGRTL